MKLRARAAHIAESASRKARDMRAAVSFLRSHPGVDPERVGAVAICASAMYARLAGQRQRLQAGRTQAVGVADRRQAVPCREAAGRGARVRAAAGLAATVRGSAGRAGDRNAGARQVVHQGGGVGGLRLGGGGVVVEGGGDAVVPRRHQDPCVVANGPQPAVVGACSAMRAA